MRKIFVICPSLSQPRFHKRVEQLKQCFEIHVFGFSRGLYEINGFPSHQYVENLGRVKDGKYLQRISSVFKAIRILRRYIQNSGLSKIYFYAFGLDGLMIARLSGLREGIYEVGDIRFDRGAGGMLAMMENFFSRYLKAIVVTSPDFINEVKKSGTRIRELPIKVIENKLPLGLSRPSSSCVRLKSSNKIRIGVIGFLRYEKPLKQLAAFVAANQDEYELLCWGDGPYKELFENNSVPNIKYFGSFKNPEELESIYESIDLNFAVYGGSSRDEIGVRLALPNKLYESIFFGVPILCRDKTAVARIAQDKGIGMSITHSYFNTDLSSISLDKIREMRQNCLLISAESVTDDGQGVIESIADLIP